MKKTISLIGTALLMLSLAACSTETGGEPTMTPTPTQETQTPLPTQAEEATPTPEEIYVGASHSVSDSGVTITISTDKTEYAAGEEIQYRIVIENNRLSWNINSFEFDYYNSDELTGTTILPYQVEKLKYGESQTFCGTLIGTEYAAEMITQPMAAETATVSDCDKITLRPYVKVMYGGTEVVLRATMKFNMMQERVKIPVSKQDNPKRITCHDPSIFKDLDGTYYIFGTHMTGGYTEDLRNWTSIDGAFRLSFTEEVREKIRAWNDDDSAGSWYDYLWAPDIIYNEAMGKYCIYLSANGDNWISNIVLLTADNVTGPYDYAGTVVYGGFTEETWELTDGEQATGESKLPERYITNGVENKKWGDKWPNCIDPCVFYDDDGNLWMAYGSWSGGIFILSLDETTGLRDYSVTYEINEHSDAYFGTKIAGGMYASGEGAYIQKIGNYYWLFISYGGLEAKGGYNVRVYRSERPDGGYVDALGNDAYCDKSTNNINASQGVRLFGAYKWRSFTYADVAQGHNSAFVDDDGRAYMVYHTRTSNGTEGHTVKVLQLFLNKEGWLCAAPYQTSGEKLDAERLNTETYAGQYEVILHELDIKYSRLESNKPVQIQLNTDGTVTGEMEGSWALEKDTSYITLVLDGVTYSGVALYMNVENSELETAVFTALGQENQLTLWGSRTLE